VCSISFQVLPAPKDPAGYKFHWPAANGGPSPLEDPEEFVSYTSSLLGRLIQPASPAKPFVPENLGSQTYVYPVAQFTPLLKPDVSTEFPAVTSILRLLSSDPSLTNSRWLFTAGYFNIHPVLSSLLVSRRRGQSSLHHLGPTDFMAQRASRACFLPDTRI
jgi:CDP-diacylglycerol--glycerol-3-phosphate 3-phosphatidyltransferase